MHRNDKQKLDEDEYEELQDEFLDFIAIELRSLKKRDESVENTSNYSFLLDLKNRTFDYQMSLETALALLQTYKINTKEIYHAELAQIRERVIDMLQVLSPSVKPKTQSTQDAEADLRKRFMNPHHEKTIVDVLQAQCKALEDPKHIKDEMLKVLLFAEREKTGMVCEFISVFDLDVPKEPGKGVVGSLLSGDPQDRLDNMRSLVLYKKIDQILEQKALQGIIRAQMIIREGVHYYGIDANTETNTAILLDAAADTRKLRMYLLPRNSSQVKVLYDPEDRQGVETTPNTYRTYKLQLDEASCVFFAFDHVRNAFDIKDLHQKLIKCKAGVEPKNGVVQCDWMDMPPRMLKNSQSTGYIGECIKRFKEKDVKEAEDLIELTDGNSKHFAINKVISDAVLNVKAICERKSVAEIEEIVVEKKDESAHKLRNE